MEAVSHTAQWTAAARALESDREDSLFSDRFARELAGDVGFELLERYAGAGTVPFLAIRTRFLDEAITTAISERGIRQVVFVAAGMDTRYLRLTWPEGTTLFELDRPALFEAKAELLPAFPRIGDLSSRHAPRGLPGDPPDPSALPSGCTFHPRCPAALESCATEDQDLRPAGPSRRAACVLVEPEATATPGPHGGTEEARSTP